MFWSETPTQRKNRPGVVRQSGNIHGCFPEVFEGVTVTDKLRELLVNTDSENADTFSEDQQQELLFHVFRALSVGGGVCQPDDNLEPYTIAAKALYKVCRYDGTRPVTNACAGTFLSLAVSRIRQIAAHQLPSLELPRFVATATAAPRTWFPSKRTRRQRNWKSPRARSTASPGYSAVTKRARTTIATALTTVSLLPVAVTPSSGRIRLHQSLPPTAFVLSLSISQRSALPCCGKSSCRSGEGKEIIY